MHPIYHLKWARYFNVLGKNIEENMDHLMNRWIVFNPGPQSLKIRLIDEMIIMIMTKYDTRNSCEESTNVMNESGQKSLLYCSFVIDTQWLPWEY